MLVQNPVNFFVNGYAVNKGGSCLDLPIAIAAGSIYEESYNQYLFSLSYLENWERNRVSWYEERKQILSDMNYLFDRKMYTSWQDTLEYIYHVIDEGSYVLLPVTYNALFYYRDIKSPLEHMIMISGYDLEDDTLLVNDCNFVKHGLELVEKEYTIYQVALETKSIERILRKSMVALNITSEEYCLYGLKEAGEVHPRASNYIKNFLSPRLISDDVLRKNDLYRVVLLRASAVQKSDARDYITYIRRNYLGWLHPFFDYFKFQEINEITEKMEKLADKIYKIRDSQLYKIHMRLLRESEITERYIADFLDEVEAIESEIAIFLRREYHIA